MMPLTNLDLLKHQSAKYHLPTAHERDAARLQKNARLAAWKQNLATICRLFSRFQRQGSAQRGAVQGH